MDTDAERPGNAAQRTEHKNKNKNRERCGEQRVFACFFSNFMTYDSGCPKPTESIQQEIAHKGSSKTKYNCESKTTSLNTLAIQSVSSTKIQFKIKLIQTSKPIYHCGGMDGVMVPSSQEQQMLPSCMKPQNRCLSEAASF